MSKIPLTNQSNFYSNKLSGDFLRLYNVAVENLSHGGTSATVEFSSSSDDDLSAGLNAVLEAIVCGCPELFFVDQQFSTAIQGNSVTINFTNKYQGENLRAMWAELDGEINRIAQIISAIPSDFDKLHRLNRYLCVRVKPQYSTDSKLGDAYGALILRKARCEGFAKAAQLILQRLNFQSVIAAGEASNDSNRQPHTWNVAKVDGENYHFDFTWNAGKTAHGIPGQEYMFLDDSVALIEHFPAHCDLPKCTDTSKTFWAMHKGIVKYHSDLSRIEIVPFKTNYLAIAKLKEKLSATELNGDVYSWMENELSGYSFGSQLSYSYNKNLNLLAFYFIN